MLTLIDHGLVHDALDLFDPGYRVIINKAFITVGNALITLDGTDVITFGESRFGILNFTCRRLDIVEFTKQFNARTADKGDLIIPVVITVYADRSFSFITKTPPAAVLLKKACKLQKASGTPNKEKVATISRAEVQKIAELKMPDLNAASIEAATSMIAGTARSMGIVVED